MYSKFIEIKKVVIFDSFYTHRILCEIFLGKLRHQEKLEKSEKFWDVFLFICLFVCFLRQYQNFISTGKTGHWAVSPFSFEIFLIVPYFLRSSSRSATRETTGTYSKILITRSRLKQYEYFPSISYFDFFSWINSKI